MKPVFLSIGNAALYLTTCALIGTGLLLELRMDKEDGSVRLLGMNPDDWGEIHQVIAMSFVALAVLHLALNWSWIRAAFNQRKLATAVLIAGLVVVGGLPLLPAPGGERHRERKEYRDTLTPAETSGRKGERQRDRNDCRG